MAAAGSILIVEDDAMIAMMVADMCDMLDYGEPAIADNLGAALALASAGNFDAALVDVHLGPAAAWPVADALAARGIPFAFMTGGGGDVPPEHDGRPTLSKPFRVLELDSLLQLLVKAAGDTAEMPKNR